MHILGSFDIINSNDKKFLAVFSLIIVILIALLMVFTFNSFSNNNDGINYYVDDIGGYNFSIPDFLNLESEENLTNGGVAKVYSNENINLGIMVSKNSNENMESIVNKYNSTNNTKLKIGDLEVYKAEREFFTGYFFKINNDTVKISIGGTKNTDILVEEMLRNI